MTAISFVLTELAAGRIAGHAVICVEARYASVLWHGASSGRIERCHATGAAWQAVEKEAADLPTELLARGSAVAGLLVPDKRGDVAVQFLAATPIAVAPAE